MNRAAYDEIFDSLENGQKKQAAEQMKSLGDEAMPELFHYLLVDLDRPEMVLAAAKAYFWNL